MGRRGVYMHEFSRKRRYFCVIFNQTNYNMCTFFKPGSTVRTWIFLLLLTPVWSSSLAQETNIYRVQSLFLYNFTKNIKWADTGDDQFTIGVLGGADVLNSLKENLENKKVNDKEIRVIAIRTEEDFRNCHMAYVARAESRRVTQYLNQNGITNTLVVTEEDMTASGAAISFVFEDSKLRFRINRVRLEEAGLKVTSTLLSMAVNS